MRIETIHLPSTLKIISANAFKNCPYVHDIYWEGTMDQWVNIDFKGPGANPCSIKSVNFYVNGTIPTSYAFPSGTTEIKKFALEGVKGLTSVTIPNSVTSIGNSSFSGCSDLINIIIPDSVTSIGNRAFQYCVNMTSINIPNGITSLDGTFVGCKSLLNLEIPNTVTYIGDSTFEGCKIQGTLSIPNKVTSIRSNVFKGFESDTLIIPDSVTTIDGHTCMWNMKLNSLVIGSGVTKLTGGFRDSTINTITIYAVTPPSASNDLLIGTHINTIYVPQASVEAYRTAEKWSSAASIIQAIPT